MQSSQNLFLMFWIFEAGPGKTGAAVTGKAAFFMEVLLRNSTFYFLIVIGSLFFNISSLLLIVYNSFVWGMAARASVCGLGLWKSVAMVSLHLPVEVCWILLSFRLSVDLSISIYSYFNNVLDSASFMDQVHKTGTSVGLGYLWVIAGCLLETFISPLMITLV